jgi:hypothetical protein
MRIRRPIPWLAVLLFLAICLSAFGFAWWYFGSPLPATLAAKQHQGDMATVNLFVPGLSVILRGYTAHWHYPAEAALALLGLIFMFFRARSWAILLAWTVFYFAAYSALGVTRYFWYYAPLVPGFVAAVGLGIESTRHLIVWGGQSISNILNRFKPFNLPVRNLGNLPRLASAISIAILLMLTYEQGYDLWQLRQNPDKRLKIYRAVGEWLRANTPNEAKVGTLEVGIIGYYAQRPMVDFAGLVQPEVAKQLTSHTTFEDAAIWAVERYRPEYLVLHEGHFPRLEQGFVKERCQSIQRFLGAPYGYSENLSIYFCQYQ